MQLCKNYANLKHYIGQKFNVKVIKATHRRSNFSKTFVSQKNIGNYRFKKKSTLKFQGFWIWKILSALLQRIFSMCVRMHGFTIFSFTCIIKIPKNRP